MQPTHVLYGYHEEGGWSLEGGSDPIFAYLEIDAATQSVEFRVPEKVYLRLHDEGEYAWRPVTAEVLKLMPKWMRGL